MRFEQYIKETNVSLASSLMEGLEDESLEKKLRILAGVSVFLGSVFGNREMVIQGIETLSSEEVWWEK
jgi:hypothetical protein